MDISFIQKGCRKMIKIAYIMNSLMFGGIDKVMLDLAIHLDKNKYEISIITIMDEEVYQPNVQKARDNGIKTYTTCDMPGLLKKREHLRRLKKILCETGPYDVVHSNNDLFNGLNLMVAKQAGVPVRISHAHNTQSQFAVGSSGFKKQLYNVYYRVMQRFIKKYATDFVGCSQEANEYVNKGCKSEIIYNGIDLNRFRHQLEDIVNLKRSIGVDNGKKILVTVGRIAKQKNPLFLLEVMKELSRINDNIHLIWVGDGRMRKDVEKLIKEYDISNITLLGTRKDIPDILHCSDYFIFPSLFEGLGIVLIEAQAAGLDCFISDTIPELADVGKCNILQLSDGAYAWAEYINNYIAENKHREIDENKLKKFDIGYMTRQCENIYESALLREKNERS